MFKTNLKHGVNFTIFQNKGRFRIIIDILAPSIQELGRYRYLLKKINVFNLKKNELSSLTGRQRLSYLEGKNIESLEEKKKSRILDRLINS